jgi:putative Mg2+ transporter-C (MgtC) family protein
LGQIIVGIGFLGAGAIIFEQREGKIKGLTTAAMMWVTAAIGSAGGLGLYWLAIFTTVFVLLINLIILPIERRMDKQV